MNFLAKIFSVRKHDDLEDMIWPFSSPKHEATFTVGKIVQRDHEDGSWQFLTGEQFDMSDAMIVGLGEMAKLDPSVLQLADLPLGWSASRQTLKDSWCREKADLGA